MTSIDELQRALNNRPLEHISFEGLTIDNIVRTRDQRRAVLRQLQEWQEWFENFEGLFSAFQELSLKERSLRKLEEHLRDFPCNGCEKRHLVCDHCISDNILPYWKRIRAEFMEVFGEAFSEKGSVEGQKMRCRLCHKDLGSDYSTFEEHLWTHHDEEYKPEWFKLLRKFMEG